MKKQIFAALAALAITFARILLCRRLTTRQ